MDKRFSVGRLPTDGRVHIFFTQLGYPIRICNWIMVEGDKLVLTTPPDIEGVTCLHCLKKYKKLLASNKGG